MAFILEHELPQVEGAGMRAGRGTGIAATVARPLPVDAVSSVLDTSWVRLLYRDSIAADAPVVSVPRILNPGSVAANDDASALPPAPRPAAGSIERLRNPAHADEIEWDRGVSGYLLTVLLALFAVLQLAFAGSLLAPVPGDALARLTATMLSAPVAAASTTAGDRRTPHDAASADSGRTEDPRECRVDLGIDVECVFH
jgi:hypothetical protein